MSDCNDAMDNTDLSTTALPRKRVAVVYHFFPHYRGAVLRELHRNGLHRYFFVGDRVDTFARIKPYGFEAGENFVFTKTRFFKSYLWQSGLIRLALDRRVDAIIYLADAQYLATWISAWLARRMGKRVLFWGHGWIRDEVGRKEQIRRRFYRLADGLLLYGNRAKQLGIESGFPDEKLHVIYNSLDTDAQKSARSNVSPQDLRDLRQKLFPGSHLPMLVCSTRLVKKRRLDELLRAMRILKDRDHESNLLLIGDGPEEEPLRRMADELGLSVHFYGACYDENEIAPMIMAANVTVAPGKVGLTAIHSLAYGTPVITHDDFDNQMPEWEAIFPGVSGGFFKYGDVVDLARSIERWTTGEYPSEEVREDCHRVIDEYYNPQRQRELIDRAVSGQPALPIVWLRDALPEEYAHYR